MSKVKSSAEFIAQNAQHVQVDVEQCVKIAHTIRQLMIQRNYTPATWSTHPLNPSKYTPHVVDWIFTVDTLNFSFWSADPNQRFEVQYQNNTWTGYWSMVAAINRALDENIPITSPSFWISSEFTPQLIAHVFRSASCEPVPLLNERFLVLKQAGEALAASHFTSFEQVIAQCHHSALQLVDWVTRNIASYNDKFIFQDQDVFIFKRAQILVADLWACFEGSAFGLFDDIDEITMFADYRVPQILVVLGAMKYSPTLLEKIMQKQLIPSGSVEEIEIRGCSIRAVDLIVDEINRLESGENHIINAVLVDFYLWDTAKEQETQNTVKIECHRTRSVYY